MIEQEVRRRGLTNNIKLGQGGIREAEFVVQSLQLINGGREPSLKVQSLQLALSELVNLQILPDESATSLQQSYLWLRKVEHCLQQFADKQTQVLPNNNTDQKTFVICTGYTYRPRLYATVGSALRHSAPAIFIISQRRYSIAK